MAARLSPSPRDALTLRLSRLPAAPSIGRRGHRPGRPPQGDFGSLRDVTVSGVCPSPAFFWCFVRFPSLRTLPVAQGREAWGWSCRRAPRGASGRASFGCEAQGCSAPLCVPLPVAGHPDPGAVQSQPLAAESGEGQGGNRPAGMEMSREAPALWRPSCWSHCAYSRAGKPANFGFSGGRIAPASHQRQRRKGRAQGSAGIPPASLQPQQPGLAVPEGFLLAWWPQGGLAFLLSPSKVLPSWACP